MKAVTLEDRVVQKKTILSAGTATGVLALDGHSGNCFSMAGSGRLIWTEAAEPIRVRDLCARLRKRYRVEEQVCTTQTLAYVNALVAEGLLLVHPDTQ